VIIRDIAVECLSIAELTGEGKQQCKKYNSQAGSFCFHLIIGLEISYSLRNTLLPNIG
jgi:hypothetical protein